jgi:hypothetical protein
MTLQYEDLTVRTGDQSCPSCGAAMAGDQRYCLSCGERRGETRVPLPASGAGAAGTAAAAAVEPLAAAVARPVASSGAAWAGAVGLLLLAMGVGVLIGRAGDPQPQRASSAPVTVVQGGAAAPATSVAAGTFTSDWPHGEEGWTVALQQLPKASATPDQVAQAKAAAVAKGAADAGALDSDAHASLEPGNYLVYAGRFDSRKAATAAKRKLAEDFPDARVVQVGAGAAAGGGGGGGEAAKPAAGREEIEKLDELSPDEYQKKSKALPKEVGIEGKPPPKDNKPAGGGSDFEEIG